MEKASAARNSKARVIKHAFCVFNGAVIAKQKIQTMRCIQDRYRLNYLKKQKKQAEHFRDLFDKAVISYKADRRKVQEQKAGTRI